MKFEPSAEDEKRLNESPFKKHLVTFEKLQDNLVEHLNLIDELFCDIVYSPTLNTHRDYMDIVSEYRSFVQNVKEIFPAGKIRTYRSALNTDYTEWLKENPEEKA